MMRDVERGNQVKGPDISIEQATAESVSKEVFNREFGWLKRELEGVNKIMATLVIVLVIGFVTLLLMVAEMVIESWRFKSGIDQALIQSLEKQDKLLEKNFNSINSQNKILGELHESLEKTKAKSGE